MNIANDCVARNRKLTAFIQYDWFSLYQVSPYLSFVGSVRLLQNFQDRLAPVRLVLRALSGSL